MAWLDANLCAVNSTFEKRPKILTAVRMDLPVNVLFTSRWVVLIIRFQGPGFFGILHTVSQYDCA
jgi:hypothetical protein